MNGTLVFLGELALSITVSAIIIARLDRLMRRIGVEVCEQGGGAVWNTIVRNPTIAPDDAPYAEAVAASA